MNKRSIVCLGITVIFIVSVIFGLGVLQKLKSSDTPKLTKTEEKKKQYKTYDMYVSINPFVKLTFRAEYEACDNTICFTGNEEVIDSELINDDAKTVYNDLDFKGQHVMDALILLCDTARTNGIAYDSVSVTTNWMDMYDDQVLRMEFQKKSKYEFTYDVFLDVKEHINGKEIIENTENDTSKDYIVSFNRDNGDSIIKRRVKENEVVSEIKAGNKNGYTFIEWQLNGKKYDFNTPVTKDITLVAKWKKGEVTTTTANTASIENPSKPTEPTTSTEPTKTTTAAPSYTSTIDKINLNENILVSEYSTGISSGPVFCDRHTTFDYVFVTNASSVLGDYKDYQNSYIAQNHPSVSSIKRNNYSNDDEYDAAIESACSIAISDFQTKKNMLTYDTTKENAAISVLEKLKNSTNKGISGFTYDVSNHAFSYSYGYLYMENAKSFDDFGKKFNQLSNISELNNAFKSITYLSDNCHRGCGDMYEPEVKVLNESLCSKYNLNCDRW